MSTSVDAPILQKQSWLIPGRWLPRITFAFWGIAAVTAVAIAVFVSLMVTVGPWSGSNSRLSLIESSDSAVGSDGVIAPSGVPSPGGFGGDSGFSASDSFKGGQNSVPAAAPTFESSGMPNPLDGFGDRQIISQGSMSVEVENVASAAAQVRAIAEGVGGFVEALSSNGVREFQQSTMTVRVPQVEFFSVFEQIKALGEVLNENAGSEDVTERFIDLEARLTSVQREEESLLSLLDRADKISEILIIERELTRVRGERERLQGQLNFLERRVDLSAITVFLTPPQQDNGQAPSGSFTVESSDVGSSVDVIKAVVGQVDGEVDQVFTSVQDERQRAQMTVRVFAKDFGLVVAAVENQGGLVTKEVREGKPGDVDSDEPNSRLEIVFQQNESSTLGRNLAIFAPLGSVGLVLVLGILLYGSYRMGVRRED